MIFCSDCRERPRAARCAGLCAECFEARMAKSHRSALAAARRKPVEEIPFSLCADEPPQAKPKQKGLFDTYKHWSLLDVVKECGRMRRVQYASMMRYERQQAALVLIAKKDNDADSQPPSGQAA